MPSSVLTKEALKGADKDQRITLIEKQIKSTVDHICDHYKEDQGVGNRSTIFERLFNKEKNSRLRAQYLEQEGEAFVEQNLVWPLLSILGYEYKIEAKVGTGTQKTSDFLVTNSSPRILGEIKNLGRHKEAKEDMNEYLNISECSYGITTDGLYWELSELCLEDGNNPLNSIATGDLRGVVADHVSENSYVDKNITNQVRNIPTVSVERFYTELNRGAVAEVQGE